MLTSSLLLLLGLVLLIKGGDLFVAAAVRIAQHLRLPRIVIGSTLVSLATTTPELVVSLMAGGRGESGLAIGNAVGSCICNIGLILGVTATLRPVDVSIRSLRIPLAAMFGFGALLFVLSTDLVLSRGQGLLLVGAGLLYFALDLFLHLRATDPDAVTESVSLQQDITGRFAWFYGRAGSVVQFIIGTGIVLAGSRLLVDAAIQLASALRIPPLLIGLTVIAVGTSLPELVTAVTSSRRNVSDLAIGNVLGANIANLTLIVGAAAILSDVTLTRTGQLFNLAAMFVFFGLLLGMLLTGRRLTRTEGVTLLVLYNLYIIALALLAPTLRR